MTAFDDSHINSLDKVVDTLRPLSDDYLAFGIESTKTETSSKLIAEKCDQLKDLLLSKNLKYGDSALSPNRIFSKSSTVEQLKVRIDDKINRIQNSGVLSNDEDTVMDLAGYLILLRIALDKNKPPEYTIDPENPRF